MARATYRKCRSCGDLHEVSDWPEACLTQFRVNRSDLPCPAIRADGMDAVMNHADGRMYDSRSGYEKAVKAMGCEIVGDAPMPTAPAKKPVSKADVARDVKTAIEQVEARL